MLPCLAYNLWLLCSAAFPFQIPACPDSSSPIPNLTGIHCHPAFLLSLSLQFVHSSSTSSSLPDVEYSLATPAVHKTSHREPRCDKWANSYVFPHPYPEKSWEPGRILAQPPGNKQTGYKEKRTVAVNLMRFFPLGRSCSLHCNGKVDTQHPRLPPRGALGVLLLLKLLLVKEVGALPGVSQQLEATTHWDCRKNTHRACLLLLFAAWEIVPALKASNWCSSFFLLSSVCFQTQADGNYTLTLIFKPQTQLAH